MSLTTLFITFLSFVYLCTLIRKASKLIADKKEEKMAFAGNVALYAAITIVMVTGVLMMERLINVFNWFMIPQSSNNLQLTSMFNKNHVFSCLFLGVMAEGHVLAVVKHYSKGESYYDV